MSMTAVKRKRGVLFDPIKVRHASQKRGFNNYASFETNALSKFPNDLSGSKAMHKAWYGAAKIDPKLALMVAQSLGFTDFSTLLVNAEAPITRAWENLINNRNYQQRFLRLSYSSHEVKNLVTFCSESGNILPQIPLQAQWQLHLDGIRGERVFLLMRCKNSFYQFAPTPYDGYCNVFLNDILNYPQNSCLAFDQDEGRGWRQIIAIRSTLLPCTGKTPATGFACSIDDLNIFAQALEEKPHRGITLDTYTFEIV
ncbi:MAG: hypothetical protein HRU20_06290 [Pseudomonadales bacterium]|nr:hypothetical protein [Pseudomonadales bacterium]